MATSIAVQEVPYQGKLTDILMTAGDATDGNEFLNDGATLLLVNNTDVGSGTYTVQSAADQYGREDAETPVTVAAGLNSMAGPFLPSIWNQVGGKVVVDFSAATMELAAVKISGRK